MHIVWDWNGTLFDDFGIVVGAVNDSLAVLNAPPIGPEQYRDHYARPVHRFYDGLLGRPITDHELVLVNEEFFAAYGRRRHEGALAAEADAALDLVAAGGGTQSVLSMAPHDDLVAETERFGVAAYMALIEGNSGPAGGPKSGLLRTHLATLQRQLPGLRREDIKVVGDTLDDAGAASDSGVDAVLYDGGSHHPTHLAAAGVPVVASLVAAVRLVGTT